MRNKLTMTIAVAALAANSVACSLQLEQILQVEEGSEMSIGILDLEPDVLALEGGTVMNIDIQIGFFDLLFGSIDGDIEIGELLIGAPAFDFLGIPALNTGVICVVPDETNPGGGTFDADLFGGTATFAVNMNTIALLGNPLLAATLPGGGFPFPFDVSSSVPFGLAEMLGLLTGSGSLAITQDIDQALDLVVTLPGQPPIPITGTVGGQITLASADAFPSSPLLDDCIALLAGP